MANLYGVANAPGLPVTLTGANFIAGNCPAGSYTLVGTSPALVAPSQGYFYAWILLTLELTFGATVPSSLLIACSIGAGSATNAIGLGSNGLTPSGSNVITAATFTPVSQTAWQGLGSTVGLWINPGGVSCTMNTGSGAMLTLFRAPDQ